MRLRMAALQHIILLMLLFLAGASSTCTDSDLKACYLSCHSNNILIWRFLQNHSIPVTVSYGICKALRARSLCYDCAKNKGCDISAEDEQQYQQYKDACAPLYSTSRSSHDTYMTGLTASLLLSAVTAYYLHN